MSSTNPVLRSSGIDGAGRRGRQSRTVWLWVFVALLNVVVLLAVLVGLLIWMLQQQKGQSSRAELLKFSGVVYQQQTGSITLLPKGYGARGERAINNETLAYLRHFPGLRSLIIVNPDITDAALDHLTALKSLQFLDLGMSHISGAGRAELERALPKCLIRREQWYVDDKGTFWTGSESSRHGFGRTH